VRPYALGIMVAINFVLLNLLGLAEPLLWLYLALVARAGLRAPVAVLAIGLTALAAAAPFALEGGLVHPIDPLHPVDALGPSHSVLLSIVLAGLGMNAVRQLIRLNADLHATRAELVELAVAADRERLARELHDLLARTLSLIAVKAELASRLSAKGDTAAATELSDVQRLARQAVRDVRAAVAGSHLPGVEGELAAAEVALRTAGIGVSIERNGTHIDPAHESTLAWAFREAATNVVKHSGARTCRIMLQGTEASINDVRGRGRRSVHRTVPREPVSTSSRAASMPWVARSKWAHPMGRASGFGCDSAPQRPVCRTERSHGDSSAAGRGSTDVPHRSSAFARARRRH
jgi:two-component system sensor histidine kinase DesK